jgi:hypothetical protein
MLLLATPGHTTPGRTNTMQAAGACSRYLPLRLRLGWRFESRILLAGTAPASARSDAGQIDATVHYVCCVSWGANDRLIEQSNRCAALLA